MFKCAKSYKVVVSTSLEASSGSRIKGAGDKRSGGWFARRIDARRNRIATSVGDLPAIPMPRSNRQRPAQAWSSRWKDIRPPILRTDTVVSQWASQIRPGERGLPASRVVSDRVVRSSQIPREPLVFCCDRRHFGKASQVQSCHRFQDAGEWQ